ncbi:hypothetical protein [Streptomyces sp. NPDC005336]|uniref:hypothetical protein n=1 Tax=unclassified Streptomyces TaxID=2593676 RepID=UPI00339FE8C6
MALPKCTERYEAGDAWLAGCSAHPALVREAWNLEALAPIRSGKTWLVVEAPLVASMQAHTRIRPEHRGPVVADPTLDTVW